MVYSKWGLEGMMIKQLLISGHSADIAVSVK
jgi:hypothetical protein